MTLKQRINIFELTIDELQNTNSRLEKERIISMIPDELKDDWQYILEILAGKHKLGYTYYHDVYSEIDRSNDEITLKQYIDPLFEPLRTANLSMINTIQAMKQCQYESSFIASIVNRTLRLGIGPSQLPKDGLAPMLAKKFEDVRLNGKYFITEKLDGNRCIAKYDGTRWIFISRSGKPLKVNIDMGDLPTDVVYDGELLSPRQTYDSIQCFKALAGNYEIPAYGDQFSTTSGLINSKRSNKDLVYNIFDVMTDDVYEERRKYLNTLKPHSTEVRILPVLLYVDTDSMHVVPQLLDKITAAGAEGLILNAVNATYQHKRTDQLIKVKNTYTMDMLVVETIGGTGKYEGQIGSLFCKAIVDGKTFEANVGSGLSDDQRLAWALHPEQIVGKIVEVAYFSYSQNATTSGTKLYSLRFPRLKRVRTDKNITSID